MYTEFVAPEKGKICTMRPWDSVCILSSQAMKTYAGSNLILICLKNISELSKREMETTRMTNWVKLNTQQFVSNNSLVADAYRQE